MDETYNPSRDSTGERCSQDNSYRTINNSEEIMNPFLNKSGLGTSAFSKNYEWMKIVEEAEKLRNGEGSKIKQLSVF